MNKTEDEQNIKIPFSRLRKQRQIKNYIVVVIYLFLAYLLSTGIQFITMYMRWFPVQPQLMTGEHIFYMVLIQAGVFIFLGLLFVKFFALPSFSFWGKPACKEKYPTTSSRIKFYLKEFFMSVVYYLLVMFFISLVVRLIGIDMKQFDNFRIENIKNFAGYFLLAVAVVAPVYEEIVFRGIVLKTFLPSHHHRKKWKTFLAAIASGLIFAAIHFNLSTFLPIFLLSLFLSFLTLRREGIVLSIVFHALNNFMSAVALLYQIKP